jgi:hypothetical protein
MDSIRRIFICGAAILGMILAGGCASRDGNKQYAVRQVFVPTIEPSARGGASWTALVPLNNGTGVSRLMAHAGIRERFPVKEVNGRCLFEVLVVKGDDDRLLLELRSVEKPRRIELLRDEPVRVRIGKCQYDFAYPSVTVAAARNERPTTRQAMLLVHRIP